MPRGVISSGFLITIRLCVGVMNLLDLIDDLGVVAAEVVFLFLRGVEG